MKNKKIYLVGYKSFLQSHLFNFLKRKKIDVNKIRFEKILKKKIKNSIVINFSTHEKFLKQKYQARYDRNLIIAKSIKNTDSKLIIISTRKVYKPSLNIDEKSKLMPTDNYSKNHLISERSCKKILKKKISILRTSNVIGYEVRKKRNSMMSLLIKGIIDNNVTFDQNFKYKKDVLPVIYFCKYIHILIKKKFNGLINVGSGVNFTLLELYQLLKINKNLKPKIVDNKKILDGSFGYDVKFLKKVTNFKIKKKDVLKEIKIIKNKIKKNKKVIQ